jgi:sucrose-phosphate synthase
VEGEEVQRLAYRRWEREQGRRDATEDLSEELSEGEKGDGIGEVIQIETQQKKMQRHASSLEIWSDDRKEKKLYIILVRYIIFLGPV